MKLIKVKSGCECVDLATVKRWFSEFVDQTKSQRQLCERDRDYYDGKQWTDEEITQLNARKQPAVVINRIKPKIDFILGVEIDTRVDPRAYPRTPAHDDSADAVTDALRYVCDKENFDRLRSDVGEDLFIEGYGGAIAETEQCGEETEIRLRYIPWDRIFYDPHSRKADFSDSKYFGIVTWWDYDDAMDDPVYGEREDVLTTARDNNATDEGDTTFEDKPLWYDKTRERIRIIEVYFKNDGEWYRTDYCGGGFLVDPMPTGDYDDKDKPFCRLSLTSSFVARNHDNERYGVARNMISPQDEVNKRRSKSLHLLTMRQFAYEDGALADPQHTKSELAKPDGGVQLNVGALRDGSFQILNNSDLTQGQMALLQEAKGEIDQLGPDAALIASGQQQMSGRLFLAKQSAGNKELGRVFDNLRDWQVRIFRSIWYMVRKNWNYEKWLRIRDSEERAGFRFVAINRPMTRNQRAKQLIEKGVSADEAIFMLGIPKPDADQLWTQANQQAMQTAQQEAQAMQQQMMVQAQQTGQQPQEIPQEMIQQRVSELVQHFVSIAPIMNEQYIENEIAALECDIILDATPDTTYAAQEQFADLMSLAQSGVQIPPDMLIEASDIKNKRKILDKMEEPDAAQAQAAQAQQELMQAQMARLQAEIELMKSQSMSLQAKAQLDAQTAQVDAQKTMADAKKSEAQAGKAVAETAEIIEQ